MNSSERTAMVEGETVQPSPNRRLGQTVAFVSHATYDSSELVRVRCGPRLCGLCPRSHVHLRY